MSAAFYMEEIVFPGAVKSRFCGQPKYILRRRDVHRGQHHITDSGQTFRTVWPWIDTEPGLYQNCTYGMQRWSIPQPFYQLVYKEKEFKSLSVIPSEPSFITPLRSKQTPERHQHLLRAAYYAHKHHTKVRCYLHGPFRWNCTDWALWNNHWHSVLSDKNWYIHGIQNTECRHWTHVQHDRANGIVGDIFGDHCFGFFVALNFDVVLVFGSDATGFGHWYFVKIWMHWFEE